MKKCPNCGVELEKSMNFCPLCGEPVMEQNTENLEYLNIRKRKQDEKELTDYQRLSELQKRKLFWEVSGIILITGIVVTFILDLFSNNNLTWSKYSIAVCTMLFLQSTLIRFWPKNLIILMLGSLASTSALVLLLDLFHGPVSWSINLAVPLLIIVHLLTLGLTRAIRNAKEKGLNLIAYSFIALGILSVFIEGILSFYFNDVFTLHWSLIVIASVLPGSAVLFFIHYRLKKGTDLRRFFHI